MLSEQELFHFQTFGFLIFRELFTRDELDSINAEFDAALSSAYRHAPFDGTARHWVKMMGSRTPFFASLLEDPRFYEPAEQLYGEDCLGLGIDANRYVGHTDWHPDTGSLDQFGVKFAFYLQPVDADTGALRVIPGSHKNPLHAELRRNLKESGLAIGEVPSQVCRSEPGDVVAFDLRAWHASRGGSDDRHMCTVVYYNNPKTVEQEAATREQAINSRRTPAHFNRPDDPADDPDWVANRDGSPRRQRWIDRMRQLGYFAKNEA